MHSFVVLMESPMEAKTGKSTTSRKVLQALLVLVLRNANHVHRRRLGRSRESSPFQQDAMSVKFVQSHLALAWVRRNGVGGRCFERSLYSLVLTPVYLHSNRPQLTNFAEKRMAQVCWRGRTLEKPSCTTQRTTAMVPPWIHGASLCRLQRTCSTSN